jgi:four helix bundle protein
MKQTNRDFTELIVWQRARDLKNRVEALVKVFPAEEKYRLSDQLIRAVRAINSNLSEGHGRFSYRDQIHFCIMARGSLSETYNHLIDAKDAGYISCETIEILKSNITEVERLLNGYITYLRRTQSNA